METRRLSVPRTARYFVLGGLGAAAEEVWFLCHGYGQLAAPFLRSLSALAHPRRLLVAPEALSRFYLDPPKAGGHAVARVGATWMTREDREAEIADYVRYLDLVYAEVFGAVARRSVRVHVLGFSQGTATASRWLTRGEARADRLVLWGGPLPPDLDPDAARRALAGTEVVLVHGRRDEYLGEEAGAAELGRIAALGLSCRRVAFDGGHVIDPVVLSELAEAG